MAWRGPTSKPVTNTPPNKINHGIEMSDMKKPAEGIAGPPVFGPEANRNRAYNIRRDKDEVKDFGITLIDIDATILKHMDTVINPVIVDAGRQVKVPINYASPERWKAIRKDGAIRDKNGKIQTPVMVFRRSTVQRNDSLITMNRYLQYPVEKKFSEKNSYDKFSVMNGFAPRKEYYSVAMPDHVVINYEFIIWTELIEQCNSVVEAINFATEDYWGDKTRYKFRTSISDYNFETTVDAGQDRIVKATFSLLCNAYLLPEKFENYKSTVQKAFSSRKIEFNSEVAGSTLDEVKTKAEKMYGEQYGQVRRYFDYAEHAKTADFAKFADFANYAATASYVDLSKGGVTTVSSLQIVQGGATGSFGTNMVSNVVAFQAVDTVSVGVGNAAMWLVSINDGTNFKTSEVVASWNNVVPNSVTYYVTEVSEIGSVPVHLSVSNLNVGTVDLTANPLSGTWTIKLVRMTV